MSFSYTHLDNPTGSGPFTFTPTYSDTSELIVKSYNGKHQRINLNKVPLRRATYFYE